MAEKKLSGLKRMERVTFADNIAHDLLQYIVSHNLQSGSRLPSERKLSEILGVSRLPLREAFSRLRGVGILESRQGSGTRVSKVIPQAIFQTISPFFCQQHRLGIQEMLEARKTIEIPIVKLAALNRTREEISRLKSDLQKMEKTLDKNRESFIEADMDFHYTLALASRNCILRTFMELMHALMIEVQHLFPDKTTNRRQSINFHRKILEAMEKKDQPKAVAEMEQHLKDIENRIIVEKKGG